MDKTFDQIREESSNHFEAGYRKWKNGFIPSEEEMTAIMAMAMASLFTVDPARALLLLITGKSNDKPIA